MNAPDQFAPLYSDEQIAEARGVKFSKVLDHLGASHKLDPEYQARNKGCVRIMVAYKNCNYRFVVSGLKWMDDLASDNQTARSGHGAIDFAAYLTSLPFPKAVGVCLAALNSPSEPAGTMVQLQTQLKFPFWPSESRASPNEFLRCALFNARNKTVKRTYWSAKTPLKIPILGGGSIEYVGEELRQLDEKVWLHLIHLGRKGPAGERVEFVAKQFCEEIGWPLCKSSYDQLRVCLRRLQATAVTVVSDRLAVGVTLSLVMECEYKDKLRNPELRRWWVMIDPRLITLFGGKHFTYIEWQQRLSLPDGIATWLHGFFCTHRYPKPVLLADLARGAGLLSEDQENVARTIRRGLGNLVEVGCLAWFKIKADRLGRGKHVSVERRRNLSNESEVG